jgi:hypothetical protein
MSKVKENKELTELDELTSLKKKLIELEEKETEIKLKSIKRKNKLELAYKLTLDKEKEREKDELKPILEEKEKIKNSLECYSLIKKAQENPNDWICILDSKAEAEANGENNSEKYNQEKYRQNLTFQSGYIFKLVADRPAPICNLDGSRHENDDCEWQVDLSESTIEVPSTCDGEHGNEYKSCAMDIPFNIEKNRFELPTISGINFDLITSGFIDGVKNKESEFFNESFHQGKIEMLDDVNMCQSTLKIPLCYFKIHF